MKGDSMSNWVSAFLVTTSTSCAVISLLCWSSIQTSQADVVAKLSAVEGKLELLKQALGEPDRMVRSSEGSELAAGQGEDPNERDIELHETILSGDLMGDDGPMPFAGNEENSFHIVTGSGTNAAAVLDGFTITGGNADGESPHHRGGGMTNEGGSPTVLNCLFKGNAAEGTGFFSGGGGMSNWIQSNATIVNCTFLGNMTATRGGGMRNYHSQPEITNCLFIGNSSADRGGAEHHRDWPNWILMGQFNRNQLHA